MVEVFLVGDIEDWSLPTYQSPSFLIMQGTFSSPEG